MKRKIAYISVFFAIVVMMLCCSVHAANVLIISESDIVHGETVAEMLGKIASDNITVEEKTIASNMSLAQTVAGITASGKTYDSVIIQLPYESIASGDASVTDCVSAIKTLYAQIGSTANTQYFIGTPAGKISNYEQEAKVSDEAVKKVISGLDTIKVSSIPVFENLKAAADKSLAVYSNDKLTTLGDLLVACTYSNGLGKKVSNLSTYTGLNSDEVVAVVGIANGTSAPVAENPVQETKPEEAVTDDTDLTEAIGSAIVPVNREPIVEMVTSDPTGLKIRIYDKENAGIKIATLSVNDANGTKIEPSSIEGEKNKSYVFKIDSTALLSAQEYKQFYIYAEDNDGCILREYFRIKYTETAENGSNYKINRAPRVRPKITTDIELVRKDEISLYVMDQTGVQKVTPKTVEENGLKEVNLYADGKYNGYDGIEGNYNWRDVKGKTTTSSKTYVKEAYTQFQDINEFFKYENTEGKVSLLLGDKKFRFNAHAVDATGLATDKIMIIDLSQNKGEKSDVDEGADKIEPSTSATNTTNTASELPTANTVNTTNTSSAANTVAPSGTVNTTNTTNTSNTANATATTNTSNTTNTAASTSTTNTTNTANTTEPKSTSKTTSETGSLKASDTTPGYADFKTNREPRLRYIVQPDGLYIEVRDCAGVACEYRSVNEGGTFEAQKSLQPKIYHYDNDKRGAEITSVKRPKEADYKKNGKEHVYRILLPISEFGDEYSKYEIVARDVVYHGKQYYIDEIFLAKKNKDGSITVNRAPISNAVVPRANLKQFGLHAVDGTGISTIELKTLPKSAGKESDIIGKWNGSVQSDWSAITYVTNNQKYVKDGLTKFEKIDTLFKKSSWVGLNPKISGEDEIYEVMVATADASGASSVKTMNFDTKYYASGDSYTATGNGTTKSTSKSSSKSSSKKSSSKSSSKKSSSKSSSKKSSSKSSSKKSSSKSTSKKSSSKSSSKSLEKLTASLQNPNGDKKKKGKKEDVKKLQNRLRYFGYTRLNVDGEFGAKTEFAVRDFQEINKLTVDGKVGPKTNAALNNDKSKGPRDKDYGRSYGSYVTTKLKEGDKDKKEIVALKRRLNNLKYSSLDLKNDDFGPNTKKSVNKFLKQNGQKENGQVTDAALEILNSVNAKSYKAPKEEKKTENKEQSNKEEKKKENSSKGSTNNGSTGGTEKKESTGEQSNKKNVESETKTPNKDEKNVESATGSATAPGVTKQPSTPEKKTNNGSTADQALHHDESVLRIKFSNGPKVVMGWQYIDSIKSSNISLLAQTMFENDIYVVTDDARRIYELVDYHWEFKGDIGPKLTFKDVPKYTKATTKEQDYFRLPLRKKDATKANGSLYFYAKFKLRIKEGNTYKNYVYYDEETLKITK